MYGLVNRAIEQLVVSLKGETVWQRVCARAGDSGHGFVALHSYPDNLTYRLVGAVSEELSMPPESVLEAFGEYWILYTAEEGYAELLNSAGRSLREFLASLDEMHSRIESIFPHMMLPWFSIRDIEEDHFHLHYGSNREGLAPFVIGLVKGVAKRFGQQIEVRQIVSRIDGGDEDVFDIRVIRGAENELART